MKKYIYYTIILIISLFAILNYIKYIGIEKDLNKLQYKYYSTKKTETLDSITILKYSKITEDLKESNEFLKKEISKRNGILIYKNKLIANYKQRIDSISTIGKIDTVYVDNDTLLYNNRYFSWSDKYTKLKGYFNLQNPYNLYINEYKTNLNLTVDIFRKDNQIGTLVKTDNPHIVISKINTVSDISLAKKRITSGYLIGAGSYINKDFKTIKINIGYWLKQYSLVFGTIFNGEPNISIDIMYRSNHGL